MGMGHQLVGQEGCGQAWLAAEPSPEVQVGTAIAPPRYSQELLFAFCGTQNRCLSPWVRGPCRNEEPGLDICLYNWKKRIFFRTREECIQIPVSPFWELLQQVESGNQHLGSMSLIWERADRSAVCVGAVKSHLQLHSRHNYLVQCLAVHKAQGLRNSLCTSEPAALHFGLHYIHLHTSQVGPFISCSFGLPPKLVLLQTTRTLIKFHVKIQHPGAKCFQMLF